MAREIKVVSLSFLDLLCNAFGAVILLSMLMIASMQQSAAEATRYTYFLADAVVWIDVHAYLKEDLGPVVDRAESAHDLFQLVSADKDRLARLDHCIMKAFEVSLDLYYLPLFDTPREAPRPRGVAAVPGGPDPWKPALRFDSDSPASQLAKAIPTSPVVNWFTTPRDRGRLRKAPSPIDGTARFYLRVEVNLGALEVPAGYYFFRLVLSSGGRELAQDTTKLFGAMELNGSGVGGRLLLRTHAVLPEKDVYEAEETMLPTDPTLVKCRQLALGPDGKLLPDAQLRTVFRRLQLADRYTPHWPPSSLYPGAAKVSPEKLACGFRHDGEGAGKDRNWSPWLCLRHERGAPFPNGAGFPIPYPKLSGARLEGQKLGILETAPAHDYYLPGLCITSRRP